MYRSGLEFTRDSARRQAAEAERCRTRSREATLQILTALMFLIRVREECPPTKDEAPVMLFVGSRSVPYYAPRYFAGRFHVTISTERQRPRIIIGRHCNEDVKKGGTL